MTPEFHRHDQWWVSPFNVTDEVRGSFSLPSRVQIHDATLRDGEQTPGVVFSVADKVAIAETVAAVGVDRIEAACPPSPTMMSRRSNRSPGSASPPRSRPSFERSRATSTSRWSAARAA